MHGGPGNMPGRRLSDPGGSSETPGEAFCEIDGLSEIAGEPSSRAGGCFADARGRLSGVGG